MIITIQDYINMVLLIFAYALVSWALIGVSILIVNYLSNNTQPIRVNKKVIKPITATQNNYRRVA